MGDPAFGSRIGPGLNHLVGLFLGECFNRIGRATIGVAFTQHGINGRAEHHGEPLLQGFLFSDTIEGGESAENIFIAYPRATSFTQWSHDAASGQYLRYVDDQPLVDFYDGHVSAANVIVYFAEHQDTDIVEDANGATSIRIIVNGRERQKKPFTVTR